MNENQTKKNIAFIQIPVLFLIFIWVIYFLEIKFNLNFNKFGIYPKTLIGIRGVILSPFIHGSTQHLINNSLPLVTMIASLFYFYKQIAFKVLFYGTIITGVLTWSFARPSYHIGASGIIYLLVSFIFFSGIFRKHYRLIALSLAVVFWYGSMVWYIFPVEEKISWEGHLSGFLTGFIFSIFFKNRGPKREIFQFSENEEFEKLFDDKGNFNPPEEGIND